VATQAELSLFSPVKVNLYLRIVGRRPDGYHELESVMLPLDFGDTLTFERQADGIFLTCDNPALPTDDRNLVVRAAKSLSTGQGVRIALEKRAPLAAGIGGGSSNAAKTLIGLNTLWNLGLAASQLDKLAAALGSDVNFFLQESAAICRGRGEAVEAIPCRLSATVLLVNPGFGISTPWAYGAWAKAASRLTAPTPDVNLLRRALATDDLAALSVCLYNALESPSVGKFPILALLKQRLRSGGASGALMSGSGATVFGLFRDEMVARNCEDELRKEFGSSLWTKTAHFLGAR
jgi:4-diphosphocytidyl-2-C-methyl-D-erythritol kinase